MIGKDIEMLTLKKIIYLLFFIKDCLVLLEMLVRGC